MASDLRSILVADVSRAKADADVQARVWSAVNDGGLLLSLICSVVTTLLISIKPELPTGVKWSDVSAVLSALAALSVGVPKYLAAERKARIYRWARSELRILARQLADSTSDLPQLRDRLATIERGLDSGILGDESN